MDKIEVNEEMMDTVQLVADAAGLKRDDPERYDVVWKTIEHHVLDSINGDSVKVNPMVAMLKESIARMIIETAKKDPSILLELEQFVQEDKES